MKTQITLIAINEQGASKEFRGNSMADVKRQFENMFDIVDFTARIYNSENGSFLQLKRNGEKTYKNPTSN